MSHENHRPIRSFIALELSTEVQQALADIQKSLRHRIPQARWTKPQGTHLTLKFLGDVRLEQIPVISAGLDEITTRYSPFELKLNGVGAFPRPSNPRVIWVGLEQSDLLIQLQREVEAVIAPLGFPAEDRPFRGHLTLARLAGENWSAELRQYFMDSGRAAIGITWIVERVVLFRSELAQSGAIYTTLHCSSFTE